MTIEATGRFIEDDDTTWYRIDDYDLLDPFLVALVTADDQWLFVSTSGALTAGRVSPEQSLFPYETDDRLHRSGGRSGPLTVVRVAGDPDPWSPFAPDTPLGRVRRSVAKTALGDRLRFSEYHPGLGLTFEYTWATAGRLGLVRTCRLRLDQHRDPVEVAILDGLVDVLPAGVELAAQQSSSTLVDSYRRSEIDPGSGLALYTLEALVSDKADPAEALRANVIWSFGLDDPQTLLSERQVRRFRSGQEVEAEQLTTGIKGSFLQTASTVLNPTQDLRWTVVADVGLDHRAVVGLTNELKQARHNTVGGTADSLQSSVEEAMTGAHRAVGRLVAAADGFQVTADQRATVHHVANALFNGLRGGVFTDDHRVEVDDVADFIQARNRHRRTRFETMTASLDATVDIETLRRVVAADHDLRRLVNEYLPLRFSRRHGDPSRPWNAFRIPQPTDDGRPAIGYEGNWRDIFQNWEALLQSYPLYIESVISKFLSASTVDGHNPYRITHEGIDWEVPEEGSWGNFGYWGDHQVVYLHRLLLTAERFHPGLLPSLLAEPYYSYGDVPYRLRPYADLIDDPKQTLDFDESSQAAGDRRVADIGGDGRLVPSAHGDGVHLATMAEKLLVPALAKLSNLVAGGGIWLNTQRPEWNDANNALVGNGVSAVTLLHLRDYLGFVDGLLARSTVEEVAVGGHVVRWMRDLVSVYSAHEELLTMQPADRNSAPVARARRRLLDDLGGAYQRYLAAAYVEGPGPAETVTVAELRAVLAAVQPHVATAARLSRRPDGLVHTYWLLRLDSDEAHLDPLYEMLEGQVAALASPDIDPETVIAMTSALYDGALYRPDQKSFVLYPNRRPTRFRDKNRIPSGASGSAVVALADSPVDLVARDDNGDLRFAARLRSARVLDEELDRLADQPELADIVAGGRSELLAAYETVFDHRSFTGRSQSMYRYEGLGSIYWHMVSKLLFALQERTLQAVEEQQPPALIDQLVGLCHRVRSGLGFMKSAARQGSFPTDPHSHTPLGMGAQQPGMTGQVKEGVLIRWAELGVQVRDGRLQFQPVLLDRSEFLTQPTWWGEADGGPGIELPAGSLGFTYCGVPVVYSLADSSGDGDVAVTVEWADGRSAQFDGGLDRSTSAAVFARSGQAPQGQIVRIDVTVP